MWTNHLKARVHTGRFYRMSSNGRKLVFQLLHLRPEGRMYVQRVCCLGEDVRALVVELLIDESESWVIRS